MSLYLAYEPHDAPGTLVDISKLVKSVQWVEETRESILGTGVMLCTYTDLVGRFDLYPLLPGLPGDTSWQVIYGHAGNAPGLPARSAHFKVGGQVGSARFRQASQIIRGRFGLNGEFVPYATEWVEFRTPLTSALGL